MRFDVLTIFPNLITAHAATSLLGRAAREGLVTVRAHDFRAHGLGRHRQVDDAVFGGGPGMVLKPDVVAAAVRAAEAADHGADVGVAPGGSGHEALRRRRLYLTPGGVPLSQGLLRELSEETDALTLLCGRYEGVDERVVEGFGFEEVSIGDYVVAGGEVAAMVVIEGVARLVPGVMGNVASAVEESFSVPLLEAPCYTRPAVWEGVEVPAILISGDHATVDQWRREEGLRRTARNRPDLLSRAVQEGVVTEDELQKALPPGATIPGRSPQERP